MIGRPAIVDRLVQPQRTGADTVERDTAGLRRGPEPTSVSDGSQAYLEAQTAHDLVLGWGGRSFIKGLYANVIRPEALDALVEHVAARHPPVDLSRSRRRAARSPGSMRTRRRSPDAPLGST